MTLSEYCQLKEKTVFSVASSPRYEQRLKSLKELFKKDINSKRRYESIDSIKDLLTVLEIRDVLSEDNVTCLKLIVGHLPNGQHDLMQKIIEYEENRSPRELTNQYAQAAAKGFSSEVQDVSRFSYISSNQTTSTISKQKKERIFETITDEIGMFWRDFGRNLKIQEGLIDEIDINNRTLSSKVTELLKHYEHKKADPQRWFFHICQALETARRKDLSRKLQNIMTMNI